MNDVILAIFRDRANELMAKSKLTKKELAKKLDMDITTLFRKFSGDRGLDIGFLVKIAEILKTTVGYLIGETDVVRADAPPDNAQNATKTIKEYNGALNFKFKNGEELNLPATPEGYVLFKELVTQKTLMEDIS